MKTTKKRIIAALLAAAMTAAVLPTAVAAEPLSETAISAEYGAKKLPAPKNITASRTADTITFQWDAVKGADRYRVYMLNEDTGKYEKYKNVSKTSCKVTGLSPKTKYKFKIAALVNNNGKYLVQKKTSAISVTTKKASDAYSVLDLSSFAPPTYGDTKSKVFSSMGGENKFTLVTSSKSTTVYSVYFKKKNVKIEFRFLFDNQDRIIGYSFVIPSYDQYVLIKDKMISEFGEPTTTESYKCYWYGLVGGYTLFYDSDEKAGFFLTEFYYF